MKGITVKENNNGVTAVFLHYSADPSKDRSTPEGKAWFERATRGMTPSMIAKELEINFRALHGKLVYEEWSPSIHLVEPYDIPTHWTRYHTIDPGYRNPCAMLWMAVKPNGDKILFREYYASDRLVKEHISNIRSIEGNEVIQWRTMDCSAWNREPNEGTSVAETYEKAGYYFRKGSKDEAAGILIVKDHLKFVPEIGISPGNPKLAVFKSLEKFRWEIEKWKYPELSPTQADKTNPKETPLDKDNHLMDALRILLQENPMWVKKGALKTIEILR